MTQIEHSWMNESCRIETNEYGYSTEVYEHKMILNISRIAKDERRFLGVWYSGIPCRAVPLRGWTFLPMIFIVELVTKLRFVLKQPLNLRIHETYCILRYSPCHAIDTDFFLSSFFFKYRSRKERWRSWRFQISPWMLFNERMANWKTVFHWANGSASV